LRFWLLLPVVFRPRERLGEPGSLLNAKLWWIESCGAKMKRGVTREDP